MLALAYEEQNHAQKKPRGAVGNRQNGVSKSPRANGAKSGNRGSPARGKGKQPAKGRKPSKGKGRKPGKGKPHGPHSPKPNQPNFEPTSPNSIIDPIDEVTQFGKH